MNSDLCKLLKSIIDDDKLTMYLYIFPIFERLLSEKVNNFVERRDLEEYISNKYKNYINYLKRNQKTATNDFSQMITKLDWPYHKILQQYIDWENEKGLLNNYKAGERKIHYRIKPEKKMK